MVGEEKPSVGGRPGQVQVEGAAGANGVQDIDIKAALVQVLNPGTGILRVCGAGGQGTVMAFETGVSRPQNIMAWGGRGKFSGIFSG